MNILAFGLIVVIIKHISYIYILSLEFKEVFRAKFFGGLAFCLKVEIIQVYFGKLQFIISIENRSFKVASWKIVFL
jgi:hypothetical protein